MTMIWTRSFYSEREKLPTYTQRSGEKENMKNLIRKKFKQRARTGAEVNGCGSKHQRWIHSMNACILIIEQGNIRKIISTGLEDPTTKNFPNGPAMCLDMDALLGKVCNPSAAGSATGTRWRRGTLKQVLGVKSGTLRRQRLVEPKYVESLLHSKRMQGQRSEGGEL